MIGILPRTDIRTNRDYMVSKRIHINRRLEELCKENSFEIVDVSVDTYSMLDWRGLHLNDAGQYTVARAVFRHAQAHLN